MLNLPTTRLFSNYTAPWSQQPQQQPQAQSGSKPSAPPQTASTRWAQYVASQMASPFSGWGNAMIDPITRQELHLPPLAKDQLLHLTPVQKLRLDLQGRLSGMPKQVYHGLRGDDEFTNAHLMNIASIPYYMGGAALVGSFAAAGGGSTKQIVARQGAGVVFYYLGSALAKSGIDTVAKNTSGVDLDMRYLSASDDEVHKGFKSVNYARYDLLEDSDYERMRKKMGIPDNIADPHQEVRARTRAVISETNTDKLFLGNLLAAIGAGYVAHRIPWSRMMPKDISRDIRAAWKEAPEGSSNSDKFKDVMRVFGEVGHVMWQHTVSGYPAETREAARVRKSVLSLMSGLTLFTGYRIAKCSQNDSRDYQSPQLDRLAPSLRGQSPSAARAGQSETVFNSFRDENVQEQSEKHGGVVL